MNTLVLRLPSVLKKRSLHLSLKSFWILSTVFLISLLVLYIFQVAFLAKETFLIQNYQKKINDFSRENQKLEISLAKQNSPLNLEALVQNLNFEKTDKVRYLQILEGQVAAK